VCARIVYVEKPKETDEERESVYVYVYEYEYERKVCVRNEGRGERVVARKISKNSGNRRRKSAEEQRRESARTKR